LSVYETVATNSLVAVNDQASGTDRSKQHYKITSTIKIS